MSNVAFSIRFFSIMFLSCPKTEIDRQDILLGADNNKFRQTPCTAAKTIVTPEQETRDTSSSISTVGKDGDLGV